MIRRVVAFTALAFAGASCGSGKQGSTVPLKPGDAARGAAAFVASCAGCHGMAAEGVPGVGPRLAGSGITVAGARSVIEDGSGNMPSRLVGRQTEADILAYLARILPRDG